MLLKKLFVSLEKTESENTMQNVSKTLHKLLATQNQKEPI